MPKVVLYFGCVLGNYDPMTSGDSSLSNMYDINTMMAKYMLTLQLTNFSLECVPVVGIVFR